jgi:hypothetical protein
MTTKQFSKWTYNGKWTIRDEAIHRGYNYAEEVSDEMAQAMRDGISLKAVLKQAFEDGFLNGFEHKFDNTNYEEKNDK